MMRVAGQLATLAPILAEAGMFLEAARCHAESGDAPAALERILRVSVRDERYREAAREAVRLAAGLDTLSVRFEQFVGAYIASGAEADADLDAFHALGELYARQGMPENAEEVFGKILERAPAYRDVASRLAALHTGSPMLDPAAAAIFADDERFRRRPRRGVDPAAATRVSKAQGGPGPEPRARPADTPASPGVMLPTFASGTIVADRYRVEAEIGRGGMATVYRAHDLELAEDVALKVFRPGPHDEEGIARFRRELKVSRRLVHPNVTRLYDIGLHDGQRYISMELLVGQSLDQLEGSPWPVRPALDCLIQVADGLQAAHEAGVIHRDIKPGNLFLTGEGVAKIMDFGIARERAVPGVTQAGMVVGTPEYLSPEQIRGTGATETSDLYALGVVAYEMFTGRKPFVHEDLMPLLQMHLLQDPMPPVQHRPGLPEGVQAMILRLMRKQPSERFPSARALGEALTALRDASPA